MSSSNENKGEQPSKKLKLAPEQETNQAAEDLSVHSRISSLRDIKLKQILSDNSFSKSLFIEASLGPRDDTAVVLLEKVPLSRDSIESFLIDADLALNLKSNAPTEANVVNYACYPFPEKGDVKATIICPATSQHVEKYKFQPMHVIRETAHLYTDHVLPFIQSQKFSLQWVYNILEGKSEADRIVYNDPDEKLGFVFLPDLKWDGSDKDSLYLIAICRSRELKSIRDLNDQHLPLLRNLKTKCLDVIKQKYYMEANKLRVYLHYQPTYYHLHVHFTAIDNHAMGSHFEKAHLLDSVISNIDQIRPDYYQKATLVYSLKENDPLFVKLKESDAVS